MDDPDSMNDDTFGSPGPPGQGKSSNYVAAKIQTRDFDATQYSFFGEPEPSNAILGGALEDGLEAPPEEDVPFRDDGGLEHDDDLWGDIDDDEDLSLAAVFRQRAAINDEGIDRPSAMGSQQQKQEGAGPALEPREPPMPSMMLSRMLSKESSASRVSASSPSAAQQHQQQLTEPMPDSSRMAFAAATGGMAQLQQQQQQWQPSSTPTGQMHPGMPHTLGPAEHSMPPAGHSGLPPPGFPGVMQQQQQQGVHPQSSGPLQPPMPFQQTPLQQQQQQQQQGSARPGVMTAEQLEARMLSAAQQQAQPQPANGFLAALQAGRPPSQSPLPPPGFAQQPQQQLPLQQPQPLVLTPQQQLVLLQTFLHQQGLSPDQQQLFIANLQQPSSSLPPPLQQHHNFLLQQFQQFLAAHVQQLQQRPQQQQQQPPMPPMGSGPGFPPPPGPQPLFMQQQPPQMPPPHMMGPGGPGFARPPPGSLPMQQQQQQPQGQEPPHPTSLPQPPVPHHERPPPQHVQQGQQGPRQHGAQQAYQQGPQQQGQQQQQRRTVSPSQYGLQDHRPSHQRRRHEGHKMMTADEIDYILRIQYMATHSEHPYHEDYYHQAYVYKYFGGRNAATFAPEGLRDLGAAAAALIGEEPTTKHAALSGLGTFVLSNIRTPKMLMDMGDARAAACGVGEGAAQRPLDQEPVLAARIMIEDCVNLLLDVEDVDRILSAGRTASSNGNDEGGLDAACLKRRRGVLMDGIVRAFKLPNAPQGAADADGAATGDRVFLRIAALVKGQSFVAKTMRLLLPPGGAAVTAAATAAEAAVQGDTASPQQHGLQLLWAVLRNAGVLFGPAVSAAGGEGERRMVAATSSLASATADYIRRLQDASTLVNCLLAFNVAAASASSAAAAGGAHAAALLPLHPAGRSEGADDHWLGSVLAALLLRASELGLGSFAAGGDRAADRAAEGKLAAAWASAFSDCFGALLRHVHALYGIKRSGAAVWGPETGGYVQALASMGLMRVVLSHADSSQAEQLRFFMSELAH